jgi:hypothetical protein
MTLEIIDCAQNSPEWYAARLGIPTASRFKDVLAKGQGLTRKKYLYTLAGERLTGEMAESFTTEAMERGHQMEAEARERYAFQRDAEPQLVGFMRRKVGEHWIGASPDALLGDDGLVEIKTKAPHLQLECLDGGRMPPEHVAQVQGQLWVSGRQWADFVSYWPKLPLFVIRVERDDAYIATLSAEVMAFCEELEALTNKYRRSA